jgi:hypothetical protein
MAARAPLATESAIFATGTSFAYAKSVFRLIWPEAYPANSQTMGLTGGICMRKHMIISLVGGVAFVLSAGTSFAGVVAVPEPATLSLLAGGVGALVAVRWLRKK